MRAWPGPGVERGRKCTAGTFCSLRSTSCQWPAGVARLAFRSQTAGACWLLPHSLATHNPRPLQLLPWPQCPDPPVLGGNPMEKDFHVGGRKQAMKAHVVLFICSSLCIPVIICVKIYVLKEPVCSEACKPWGSRLVNGCLRREQCVSLRLVRVR